jgi:diguanylate cyclase (GGDEF)-like protein
LGKALAHSKALERALALCRQEALAAQQQLTALSEANAKLRASAAERELEVARVRHSAHHDELTRLPNRVLLLDRLDQALARAQRQQKHLALLFLDLDRFKDVNDQWGHSAGDMLLRRVAKRLQACIRAGDTACRYGGDEFVLLLPDVDDEQQALDVAEKIRRRLAKPCLIEDRSISVTASIGVAVYPVHARNQDELIKRADFAMYLAKVPTVSKARRGRKKPAANAAK